jgi:hypothetical protein
MATYLVGSMATVAFIIWIGLYKYSSPDYRVESMNRFDVGVMYAGIVSMAFSVSLILAEEMHNVYLISDRIQAIILLVGAAMYLVSMVKHF